MRLALSRRDTARQTRRDRANPYRNGSTGSSDVRTAALLLLSAHSRQSGGWAFASLNPAIVPLILISEFQNERLRTQLRMSQYPRKRRRPMCSSPRLAWAVKICRMVQPAFWNRWRG